MATTRIPGVLFTIIFVRPWHMKPAPTIATRMGFPCSARALRAVSTRITGTSFRLGGRCKRRPESYALRILTDSKTHLSLQLSLDPVKQGKLLVLLGDHRYRQRPRQVETRVIVHEATFRVRRIELANLIACIRIVAERLIAMGKTLRNVKCALVVLVQLNRHVLQIGRALRTQIHNDVENCTTGAAHQLALGRRRILEMHAAQRSLLEIGCEVGLGNDRFQPMSLEFILAKRSREEASRVLPALQIDNKSTFKL